MEQRREHWYGRLGCIGMQEPEISDRVEACLKNAAECNRRAVLVIDDAQRKTYRGLALLWRDMARQLDMLRHDSPNP